jgi:hypothetical protein
MNRHPRHKMLSATSFTDDCVQITAAAGGVLTI